MEPESEDTHKIINFIQNIPNRICNPLKFSDKSRFFLSQLINDCKTAINSKKQSHTKTDSRFIGADHPFPKSTSYDTVPTEIALIIHHHEKYSYKASVAIHNRTYNFNVILFPKRQSLPVLQKEAEQIVDQNIQDINSVNEQRMFMGPTPTPDISPITVATPVK